jgi:hypothetical protein
MKCIACILDFVSLYIVLQIMKIIVTAFMLILLALLGFYLKISAIYFSATLAAIGFATSVLLFILFVN